MKTQKIKLTVGQTVSFMLEGKRVYDTITFISIDCIEGKKYDLTFVQDLTIEMITEDLGI